MVFPVSATPPRSDSRERGKDGALLIPHLAEDQLRLGMLMVCYAMFGISLFATLFIVPQVWQRLVQHKTGAAASVPTVWIVLGPFGQSITAANLLAGDAAGVLPLPFGQAASAFGLFYGAHGSHLGYLFKPMPTPPFGVPARSVSPAAAGAP
ncbi:MAG: hypothetical protein ACRDR6_10195 [Pseudonocardiaceae bacterium]